MTGQRITPEMVRAGAMALRVVVGNRSGRGKAWDRLIRHVVTAFKLTGLLDPQAVPIRHDDQALIRCPKA